MKRLQLQKNKLARLAISVGLVLFLLWLFSFFTWKVYHNLCVSSMDTSDYDFYGWRCWFMRNIGKYGKLFQFLEVAIASFLPLRFIWFGRILPRRRITRSKED